MGEKTWQLQEAKNKFSRLVESAQKEGPQVVTKRGKKAAVVISYDEYNKLITPKGDLVKFFQSSPLRGEDVDLERAKDLPREILSYEIPN